MVEDKTYWLTSCGNIYYVDRVQGDKVRVQRLGYLHSSKYNKLDCNHQYWWNEKSLGDAWKLSKEIIDSLGCKV